MNKSGWFIIMILMLVHGVQESRAQGCPTPTDVTVTNVSAYSATVRWSGTAQGYRVLVTTYAVEDPQTFEYWDIDTTVTGDSAVIPVLPNKRYSVCVQSICGGGASAVSQVPAVFSTACDLVYVYPWGERFEGGEDGAEVDLPCWSNEHVAGGYNRRAEYGREATGGNGTMKMVFPASDSSVVKISMPSFVIPDSAAYQMDFAIYRNDYSPTGEGIRVVMLNADLTADTTFVPLNIAEAGDVVTESEAGWYTYGVIFAQSGVNSITMTGYNGETAAIYVDDIHVREITTCAKVRGVEVSGSNHEQARIRWEGSGAAHYQVVVTTGEVDMEYLTRIDTAKVVYNNADIVTDTVTVTGLTADTEYYVYVRGVCTEGSGDWSGYANFRTACEPVTITKSNVYTNGFEEEEDLSGRVSCWDIRTEGEGYWPSPLEYPYYARSGSKMLFFGAEEGTNDTSYIVMRETTNPVNTLRLRFWLQGMAETAAGNDSIIVGVMSDAGDESSFVRVAGVRYSSTIYDGEYEEMEVHFGSYTGPEGRIAIMRVPQASEGWYGDTMYYGSAIDDVTIDLIPTCQRVTGTAVRELTESSAKITWGETGAERYHVVVADTAIEPTTPDEAHIIYSDTVTGDSITMTGLTPVTDYYIYVRGECAGGDRGDYSREYVFRTAGVLPYYQGFDSVEIFPKEMTEYRATNLDSVVAGTERAVQTRYYEYEVSDNVLGNDTATIRYNIYDNERFGILATPVFVFDSAFEKRLTFDICKRECAGSGAAGDTTNVDDRIYLMVADAEMTRYEVIATWTNDGRAGGYSLRDDIGRWFTHYEFDLTRLHGAYRILFGMGSEVEDDDYDIHIENLGIGFVVVDTFTVTATSADESMGEVTGGGEYVFGAVATIAATANAGYRFVAWSDNDSNAVRRVTVTRDTVLVAYFEMMPTGVGNVEEEMYVVYAEGRQITVEGAEGSAVEIYDMAGREVRRIGEAKESERVGVNAAGVYYVRVSGKRATAIMVK